MLAVSCSTTRTTTTQRTAIEQALLTESLQASVERLDFRMVEQRVCEVSREGLEAVEQQYVLSSIDDKLLKSGARKANEENPAEITIEPQLNVSNIDDSGFLVGIPGLMVTILGTRVELPELALYGVSTQTGRSRVSAYAIERESGSLLFSTEGSPERRTYQRWTVLFFLRFRSTNLKQSF